MKQIITCICLLFTTAMIAQTTPTTSSEARKINMSRTNGKAISNIAVGVTDGPAASSMTPGDFGMTVAPVEGGVEIKGFAQSNSSARAAKMKVGDVITMLNSKTISSQADLATALKSYTPGDVVTLQYTRGVRKLTKDVRIGMK